MGWRCVELESVVVWFGVVGRARVELVGGRSGRYVGVSDMWNCGAYQLGSAYEIRRQGIRKDVEGWMLRRFHNMVGLLGGGVEECVELGGILKWFYRAV